MDATKESQQGHTRTGPSGIGGWLLFFCISLLVFTPLIVLGNYLGAAKLYEGLLRLTPETAEQYRVAMRPINALVFWHTLAGMTVALLILLKVKRAITITKVFLFASPFVVIWINTIALAQFGKGADRAEIYALAGEAVGGFIYSAIWLAYFYKSKRVRNTFYPEPEPPPLPASEILPPPLPTRSATQSRKAQESKPPAPATQMNWGTFIAVCLGVVFLMAVGAAVSRSLPATQAPVAQSVPAETPVTQSPPIPTEVTRNEPIQRVEAPVAENNQTFADQQYKEEYAKHEAAILAKYPDIAKPGTVQYSLVAAEVANLQMTEPEIFKSPDYVYRVLHNVEKKHPAVFKGPFILPPQDLIRIKVDFRGAKGTVKGICTNNTNWKLTRVFVRVQKQYHPRRGTDIVGKPDPLSRVFELTLLNGDIFPYAEGDVSFALGDFLQSKFVPSVVEEDPRSYELHTSFSVEEAHGVKPQ